MVQPVLAAAGLASVARRPALAVVLPQLPSACNHWLVSRFFTRMVTDATPVLSVAEPVAVTVGGGTTALVAGVVTTVSGAVESAAVAVKLRVAVWVLAAWSVARAVIV